ncbi:MAG: hypothetical protein K8R21_09195, partial [Leptospira sp.]|nr:hypothetical protein [Leptospira sp.]
NKVFTVSAKEMTDTYEAGKLYAYSAPSKSKPSERTPLPFESVKTRIKEELENSKRKAEFDKLTGGFKKDYSLKVAVEQLEAGSI